MEENSSLCGLKTKVSFIREALAAYYWMIEQKQLGKNIFSQEPGKNLITQLESLALRNVPLKIQKDK